MNLSNNGKISGHNSKNGVRDENNTKLTQETQIKMIEPTSTNLLPQNEISISAHMSKK